MEVKKVEYIIEKTACQDSSCRYNDALMQHGAICEKKPIVGRSISRRGLAKKSGCIGKKITGISRRRFYPNLQRVKVRFPQGTVRTVRVCVGCLQAGKVLKAAPLPKTPQPVAA